MEPLHEALRLIQRQAELENAIRRPGGIRVSEERELYELRRALTRFPAAVTAITEAVSLLRRPVDTISVEHIEKLMLTGTH